MPAAAMNRSQVGQNFGSVAAGAGDRDIFQILQGIDAVLRGLGGDRIADSGLGIEPECRRGLKASAQRDQQVGGDVALGEAHLLRLWCGPHRC